VGRCLIFIGTEGHALAESEGKPPADFDRHIEILDEDSGVVEIDEDMLLEAMQDLSLLIPGSDTCRQAEAVGGTWQQ
jgi:hypothetical protein